MNDSFGTANTSEDETTVDSSDTHDVVDAREVTDPARSDVPDRPMETIDYSGAQRDDEGAVIVDESGLTVGALKDLLRGLPDTVLVRVGGGTGGEVATVHLPAGHGIGQEDIESVILSTV